MAGHKGPFDARRRKPQTHDLKTWPAYFNDVLCGDKTFEVRRDDRDFQVGDRLRLREYNPHTGYTGQFTTRIVAYLLPGGEFGIEDGYCVMGLRNDH